MLCSLPNLENQVLFQSGFQEQVILVLQFSQNFLKKQFQNRADNLMGFQSLGFLFDLTTLTM